VKALAEGTALPCLRSLNLSSNQLGPEGGRALAGAPWLDQLDDLVLWDNSLGTACRRELKQRLGKRVQL
jgi:hypothetical protein